MDERDSFSFTGIRKKLVILSNYRDCIKTSTNIISMISYL